MARNALGQFLKGNKHPPNIEKKRLKAIRKANLGKIPKHFKKTQEAAWKAITKRWEDKGYGAKHQWVRQNWGKSTKCDLCGAENLTGRKVHWANKNHKYRQNRKDWFRVCRPCHAKYDKENNGTDFRNYRGNRSK